MENYFNNTSPCTFKNKETQTAFVAWVELALKSSSHLHLAPRLISRFGAIATCRQAVQKYTKTNEARIKHPDIVIPPNILVS